MNDTQRMKLISPASYLIARVLIHSIQGVMRAVGLESLDAEESCVVAAERATNLDVIA